MCFVVAFSAATHLVYRSFECLSTTFLNYLEVFYKPLSEAALRLAFEPLFQAGKSYYSKAQNQMQQLF